MRITPIDIAHKSFGKKMMGLDADEVMDFLQQIAAQMESLIQERNTLKEAIREKELSLMEYKERDQVLKETIATATQMADRLRQDADREAKLIIADAQQKAEIITRDSRDSLKKMYQEVTELKRARMQFEANLKALAQAHLSLLEQGEKYMPQAQLPNHNIVNGNGAGRSPNVSPLSAE
ncbi:DivIVA domain-containing protein [Bdellovibrio bacteriovorus]|uniref:Cell division protein DivIVA-like protein n=1 Tax=Bdellovibrio bacteriovorus str. Tiberius TaxID=1069642 RepID=K7ZE53_BDEBC|nr:DivIVA domain-containing protein [Bdellovibrio bacteriovorus]AFY00162.1 cell division protein DivIVA-like protein [Bdellovibrio bacteriovorus str. Tiberius]